MGNGSPSNGIDVPNTVFTVCSRKSAYLKNPRINRLITTEHNKKILERSSPLYSSISLPHTKSEIVEKSIRKI